MCTEKLDCSKCRELIKTYVLGMLESHEASFVISHLESCEECRALLSEEEVRLHNVNSSTSSEEIIQAAEQLHKESRTKAPIRREVFFFILALCVVMTILTAILIPLNKKRKIDNISSSAYSLQAIGIAFNMYADETENGKYPTPVQIGNVFVPDLSLLFPKYLTDPTVFINPTLPGASEKRELLLSALEANPPDWVQANEIIAKNYLYIPWATQEVSDLEILSEHLSQLNSPNLDDDLENPESTYRLYRLRDGVERFFTTDLDNPVAQVKILSAIPVMLGEVPEKPDSWSSCVLFMDGHVEIIHLGEKYPLLSETAELFGTAE